MHKIYNISHLRGSPGSDAGMMTATTRSILSLLCIIFIILCLAFALPKRSQFSLEVCAVGQLLFLWFAQLVLAQSHLPCNEGYHCVQGQYLIIGSVFITGLGLAVGVTRVLTLREQELKAAYLTVQLNQRINSRVWAGPVGASSSSQLQMRQWKSLLCLFSPTHKYAGNFAVAWLVSAVPLVMFLVHVPFSTLVITQQRLEMDSLSIDKILAPVSSSRGPLPVSSASASSPVSSSRGPSPVSFSRGPSPVSSSRVPSPVWSSRGPSPVSSSHGPSPVSSSHGPSPVSSSRGPCVSSARGSSGRITVSSKRWRIYVFSGGGWCRIESFTVKINLEYFSLADSLAGAILVLVAAKPVSQLQLCFPPPSQHHRRLPKNTPNLPFNPKHRNLTPKHQTQALYGRSSLQEKFLVLNYNEL
eukprot:g44740.t1